MPDPQHSLLKISTFVIRAKKNVTTQFSMASLVLKELAFHFDEVQYVYIRIRLTSDIFPRHNVQSTEGRFTA